MDTGQRGLCERNLLLSNSCHISIVSGLAIHQKCPHSEECLARRHAKEGEGAGSDGCKAYAYESKVHQINSIATIV